MQNGLRLSFFWGYFQHQHQICDWPKASILRFFFEQKSYLQPVMTSLILHITLTCTCAVKPGRLSSYLAVYKIQKQVELCKWQRNALMQTERSPTATSAHLLLQQGYSTLASGLTR